MVGGEIAIFSSEAAIEGIPTRLTLAFRVDRPFLFAVFADSRLPSDDVVTARASAERVDHSSPAAAFALAHVIRSSHPRNVTAAAPNRHDRCVPRHRRRRPVVPDSAARERLAMNRAHASLSAHDARPRPVCSADLRDAAAGNDDNDLLLPDTNDLAVKSAIFNLSEHNC